MSKSTILLFCLICFFSDLQYIYSQNTWTSKTDFGGGLRQAAVGFSINGKGYVSTGKNISAYQDLWEYDPTANTWTQKADFGGVVRSNATGVATSTKGYIGLGVSLAGLTVYQDFWEYDPTANTWTQKANFSGVARKDASAFSLNDKIYMGIGATLVASRSDFYEYNPTNNTWTSKASYDGGIRSAAVSFAIDGYGYIGCGTTGLTKQKDLWQYNPTDDSWIQKTDFGGSIRTAAVGFNIYNKGYIATGSNLANLDDMYEYDPSVNTWIVRSSFSGGIRTNAVAFGIYGYGYLGTGNNLTNQVDFYQYTPGTTPSVNTTAISTITGITASSGGNVVFDGTYSVTARGVVWSTSTNPTIASQPGGGITSNGTGTGTFTSSLTGLSYLTTYYVRSYATNSAGTSYGTEVSFTTIADYPTLSTTAISSITSTTASSGGNISDNGGDAVTARGVVWNTSTAPTIALSTKTSDGTGSGAFASSLTSLSPGTTYYVRAYATNSIGTSYGNEVSFTTDPIAPTLTTTAISNITSTTASSGGNISDNGGAAVTARGVVWNTATSPTIALSTKTSDGTGSGSFTSSLTSLSPGTTYYVRAYATNSVGTSYGNEVSFTTDPIAPTLTTTAISSITSTTASSGGNISDNGGDAVTARGVVWNTSTAPTIALSTKTSDGTGSGAFASSITSLSPGTTYYVRAYATNSIGTSYGNEVSFTTDPIAPTLSTTAISSIGSTTASSGGNITDNGGATISARGVVWDTSTLPTIALPTITIDGTGSGSFSSSITSLSPGTTYYVRAYATNSVGTSYGNEVSFTTLAIVPSISTTVVSGTSTTFASSGGNVTYDGGDVVTEKGLVWSSSINTPTLSTYDGITSNGTGTGAFTQTINALCPGTTYYVRAFATNSIGTSYGATETFVTSNSPGDIWVQKTNFGIGRDVSYAFVIDNKAYFCGGRSGVATDEVWEYDIAEDVWTQKVNFTGGIRFGGIGGSYNNIGYFGLGHDGTNFQVDWWSYNPNSNLWTAKTNFPALGRYANSATSNGKIYAGLGQGNLVYNDWYEYNPTTDNWVSKANFGGGNRRGAFVFSIDDKIYAGLGNDGTTWTSDVWEYNTNTDTWVQKNDFPGDKRETYQATAIGLKGFIFCGELESAANTDDVWEYDNTYDLWVQKSDLPSGPRRLHTVFSNGEKGYLALGANGGTFNDIYEYTPSTIRTFYLTNIDNIVPISADITVNKDNNFNGCVVQAITDKGIVWGLTSNPTTLSNLGIYADGTANQDFNYTITGLSGSTIYFVRPYITTIQGTIYGNEESFTTPPITAPILGITSVSGIGDVTANIHHSITSNGYSNITESGLVYSTSSNPDINSYSGGDKLITSNVVNTYNTTLYNLISGTQYYLRFYSTNGVGTTYSNEINFTTNTISDDDDNDGISDNSEDDGPNNGDGNGDGIPDNLQANVATFYIDENGKFVTVEAINCASLSNITMSTPEVTNLWYYPYGVLEFTVPCEEVEMAIYYHGFTNFENFVYRKTNSAGRWNSYPSAEFYLDTIGGIPTARVNFPLIDGLLGDADGLANGSIYDPGGPAILISLNEDNIPTLSEWARSLMLILFLIIGMGYAKKYFS